MTELDQLNAEMQILTKPEVMKELRFYLLITLDNKGVTLADLCRLNKVSYQSYYRRIFGLTRLDLAELNEVLKMLRCKHKLELINGEINKVYQSSMNN